MTPEEKNMLERTLRLAEENNGLLVKMNRRARTGHILQIFYWLLIIGLSFGAYYFIQPYVNWLESLLGGSGTTTATSTTSSFNLQNVEDLMKSFQGK